MCEILFTCGDNNRAVVASFPYSENLNANQKDVVVAGVLLIESASDLQKILRFETFVTQSSALNKLEGGTITAFQSSMGALLFLIPALLSRGLADRDDPNLPLVTAPFGHASQEIVNLLLCGEVVANVFDERMDLGGGMFLKGISKYVEVGFLTLLESLNFCKVGQNLKCPKWPIWVIGSESHYTVLFSLDPSVQEENELELRESQIRRAFDARDQSGGGGFISVEAFHLVVMASDLRVEPKFGRAMAVDGGAVSMQRPRLTKLNVSVPPKWTPEEYMTCAMPSSSEKDSEVNQPKPAQHAPLVDCIRTRWPRAICSWAGDPPSIV
ncbi:hypothetical protein N665_1193s0001 [Sinapis alba]|nr:hypothetical protein N665_1193s0001 [Sinapis alba]